MKYTTKVMSLKNYTIQKLNELFPTKKKYKITKVGGTFLDTWTGLDEEIRTKYWGLKSLLIDIYGDLFVRKNFTDELEHGAQHAFEELIKFLKEKGGEKEVEIIEVEGALGNTFVTISELINK